MFAILQILFSGRKRTFSGLLRQGSINPDDNISTESATDSFDGEPFHLVVFFCLCKDGDTTAKVIIAPFEFQEIPCKSLKLQWFVANLT